MTGVTSEAETANTEHQSSPPVFSGVRGAQSLVFGVVFSCTSNSDTEFIDPSKISQIAYTHPYKG
jgi:hypothetical protein